MIRTGLLRIAGGLVTLLKQTELGIELARQNAEYHGSGADH